MTNWLTRYATDKEETRQALESLTQQELHDVYKQFARKLSPAKQRSLTVDTVVSKMQATLTIGSVFLK